MNKLQRRNFLIALTLLLTMIFAGIGIRYFPINKLLKMRASEGAGYVQQKEYNTNPSNTLLFDFEENTGQGSTNNFYKGIAHSGQYSARSFGTNSYSPVIERKAGDIGVQNLSAVAMSAWVYIFPGNNDPLGYLVFAASNNKINIAWKGIRIAGKDIPHGKWFKISGFFDLSDVKMNPETKLEFYFWNNSSTDILTDDMFLVFGGPQIRKGDSARVNLTNGNSYMPVFNLPPFPFSLFEKEEISNDNSSFLVNQGKTHEGDISPYDRLVSGHFISGQSGTEDLLVITPSGEISLFAFCIDKHEFRKINLTLQQDIRSYFLAPFIQKGSFSGNGNDQLLLAGPGGTMIGEFGKIRNICAGSEPGTAFRVLTATKTNPFAGKNSHVYPADLNGDKKTEILEVAEDGSWKIFRIETGKQDPFHILASGPGDMRLQWSSTLMDYKISIGHFLPNYPQDILLTVWKEKKKHGYSYSLQRFDPGKNIFIPCFPEKQNYLGKTIGLDTLTPGDEFFTGNFDNTGKPRTFRYNRDWRFDLKEIRFNDSSFRIIANMDFQGFDKDRNPKYYEILRLFSGSLVKPALTSMLVIGKNCKQRDKSGQECTQFEDLKELPNTIQVYSLGQVKK